MSPNAAQVMREVPIFSNALKAIANTNGASAADANICGIITLSTSQDRTSREGKKRTEEALRKKHKQQLTAKKKTYSSHIEELIDTAYSRPLKEHCARATRGSMVNKWIELHYGAVPIVKSIDEPVSIVLKELLCAESLEQVDKELQQSLDLKPGDLRATLEFLSELLVPRAL